MEDSNKTPDQIKDVAEAIDELADNEAIQAINRPLFERIPSKIRARIYEAGKWLGLAGAAGLAVAGILNGDAQRFVEAGGVLILAISNFVAKANISA